MMLGVKLKAKLGDEVDLCFKEIDMMFLVVHQLLEEAARHVVRSFMGSRRCYSVSGTFFDSSELFSGAIKTGGSSYPFRLL